MPRVGNKKSRKGCLRCKTRKVKCDETRPSCEWCKAHALPCEYPTDGHVGSTTHFLPTPDSEASEGQPSHISHAEDELSNLFPSLTDRRLLELGLFQYYLLKVAPDFPYGDKERGLLLHAQLIPDAALRSPCLLNTLFAYSLLHMHVQIQAQGIMPRNVDFFEEQGLSLRGTSDGSRISLAALHAAYLDLALKEQRAITNGITGENADALCITALWLAMIFLVHSSQQGDLEDYQVPTQWFALQASFGMCLATARPLLSMDSATSMMVHAQPTIDNRGLDHTKYNIFRDLLDWQAPGNPEVTDFATQTAYESSVAYLQTVHARISERESPKLLGRRILAFPNVPSSEFIRLLTEHRPRALVILAHLLAMTKGLETVWWIFQGVADYHVRGLVNLVPAEWQWAMEWPLMVISDGRLPLDFES